MWRHRYAIGPPRADAVIALYHPAQLRSVGFAGALNKSLHVGDIFSPAAVIDARDGSRHDISGGKGTLLTFMAVADVAQKRKLAQAYSAAAVDMEAAAVAAAAQARGIVFGATKVISDELDFDMPGIGRLRQRGRPLSKRQVLCCSFPAALAVVVRCGTGP